MLNSDLAKPEVDLAVCEYTDIPMHVSLATYEYTFDSWTNDSRYLYSHENMHKEIHELNVLMRSKIPWISVFFISAFSYAIMLICFMVLFPVYRYEEYSSLAFTVSCIFLVAFIHYMMCIICRYLITKNIILSLESKIKELNKKYKHEQIYFKLINFRGLGFRYLKFLPIFKNNIYFTLRVVYIYCKII
ncbi:hypothetical protein YYC_03423 [Plasmodium yoelii 17X]|uniref:Uncharacterized protein n=2 Tax=Plasmodium yoelii TaxID=5861 RepID=A0A078K425_PLAYE|nr:conserved Plasmodium protein, unknown function [Plasmodium yoelii]ETB59168.1 hypothetical protein YYC_03423 [Plasmodium yoelii 17X]CDU16493.1 conserved Plasmodium protein, unknown function [Plasmodium yoelii]VTZ73326.1 conserved Plasmodium protein, unknown function [Plasmodium yoelii]|eukprot:XP_022811561.1 conserved Plasmodium protein, unknown function [Plasmodium yoelii]